MFGFLHHSLAFGFQSRLLNTIGVTRGFGDHHLVTVDDNIPIKPFLLPVPEVSLWVFLWNGVDSDTFLGQNL